MLLNVPINAGFTSCIAILSVYDKRRTRRKSHDTCHDIPIWLKNEVSSHSYIGHCIDTPTNSLLSGFFYDFIRKNWDHKVDHITIQYNTKYHRLLKNLFSQLGINYLDMDLLLRYSENV